MLAAVIRTGFRTPARVMTARLTAARVRRPQVEISRLSKRIDAVTARLVELEQMHRAQPRVAVRQHIALEPAGVFGLAGRINCYGFCSCLRWFHEG